MPEPAVTGSNNPLIGRRFTRSRLRDQIGPSVPSFHLLEHQCFRDVNVFHDDFFGAINTDFWDVSNSGGAGVSNFGGTVQAAAAGATFVRGDAGTTDDGDVRLITDATMLGFFSGNRCGAIFRVRMPSTVANSKFEVGFIDAAAAGAVNVKATPTSTRTDYAVVVRDTDDDTNLTLVTDGTTDAAAATDGSFTFATATWYAIMVILNENREAFFWVDSQYQGRVGSGPDTTVALGLWAYVQDRDDANNKQLDLDYIHAWQERVAI